LEKGKSMCKPAKAGETKNLDGTVNKDRLQNRTNKASLNKGKGVASKKTAPVYKWARTLAKKIDDFPTTSVTKATIGLLEVARAARAKAPITHLCGSLIKKKG